MTKTQALSLKPRAGPQSSATCLAGFNWTENDAQMSPCLLAATVIAPCSQTGAWNVIPVTEGNHYNPPSATNNTVTDCYCSWAAYNLLNACTACQNVPDSITTWQSFKTECGSHASTSTYYPSNISLAGNVSLPFYASVDPTTWQNGKFDEQQAQSFSGQPDVNPTTQLGNGTPPPTTSASSHSSTPTGAIAGGVVGGVAVLVIGALIAFWFIRRRRSRRVTSDIVRPAAHGRSLSDMTQSIYPQPSDFPYSQMATPGPNSIHTHESGPATVSRFNSIYTTPPHGNSPTRGPTPAPSLDPSLRMSVTSYNPSNAGFQPMAATMETPLEDVVQPYVVNQHTVSRTNLNMGRKGPINLQYDSPTSPPVNRAEEEFENSTDTTSRPRVNPPAYTPYPPVGAPSEATTPSEEVAAALRDRNGHSHRPRPGEKGSSFDTDSPWTSMGSRVITTSTPEGSGPSTGQMLTPVSPTRHVVNASVISGTDDGPEIA